MTPEMTRYLLLGGSFIFIFIALYLLVLYIRERDFKQQMYNKLETMEHHRLIQRTQTEKEQKSRMQKYIYNLDSKLYQAGIQRIIPKFTVEIYLAYQFISIAGAFLLASNFGYGMFFGLFASLVMFLINKMILLLLTNRTKNIIENNLLECLSLISGYSATNNELTLILFRVGRMMPYPLSYALMQCHTESVNSGDTHEAFEHLRHRINHKIFRQVILLLELCSQNTNNYTEVIDGCSAMVHRYLEEEKEKKTKAKALMLELVMMVALIFVALIVLTNYMGTMSLEVFFFQDTVGQISACAYLLVIFWMLKKVISFNKK